MTQLTARGDSYGMKGMWLVLDGKQSKYPLTSAGKFRYEYELSPPQWEEPSPELMHHIEAAQRRRRDPVEASELQEGHAESGGVEETEHIAVKQTEVDEEAVVVMEAMASAPEESTTHETPGPQAHSSPPPEAPRLPPAPA